MVNLLASLNLLETSTFAQDIRLNNVDWVWVIHHRRSTIPGKLPRGMDFPQIQGGQQIKL
jgi:hypothetical protein